MELKKIILGSDFKLKINGDPVPAVDLEVYLPHSAAMDRLMTDYRSQVDLEINKRILGDFDMMTSAATAPTPSSLSVESLRAMRDDLYRNRFDPKPRRSVGPSEEFVGECSKSGLISSRRMEEIIRSIGYREYIKVELRDSAFRRWSLFITMQVKDRDYGERAQIGSSREIESHHRTSEEVFKHFIMTSIMDLEIHEMREQLYFNGERFNDPHNDTAFHSELCHMARSISVMESRGRSELRRLQEVNPAHSETISVTRTSVLPETGASVPESSK